MAGRCSGLAEVAGETVVVWLRVGNHGIYGS
jgi:hypothetical protein